MTPEQRLINILVAQRNDALNAAANLAAERDALAEQLDTAQAEIKRLQQDAELNMPEPR